MFSKIDKAIVNATRMTTMTQLEVEVLDPGCSDHSPLMLHFVEQNTVKPRPLKFMNHLVQHEDFMSKMQAGWNQRVNGNLMHQVWVKLEKVKQEMKSLQTKEFSNIEKRILDARKNLKDI